MISFPTDLTQITESTTFRAGGTDIQARINGGIFPTQNLISLRDLKELNGVTKREDDNVVQIGSMTPIHDAANALHGLGYQCLVEAFHGLATPGIRRVATVGGNLFQASRCPYYRRGISCLYTDGQDCPATAATTAHFSGLETTGCLAVHPSTCAMALLAYQATVVWHNGIEQPLSTALTKPRGELCVAINLPPSQEQMGAWVRISSRAHAEWPLIEGVYSKTETQGTMVFGALAPQPIVITFEQQEQLYKQLAKLQFRDTMTYKKQLLNPLVSELFQRVEGT